ARVKECLKPIVERAAEKNVRLGIEGRRGYEEIPSEREIPPLLDEIAAPHVGYWHDMGHIQIKENLGFLDHAEWLRAIASRTIGMVIWVFHDPNQRAKMAEALRTADYRCVVVGISSYLFVEIFAALRWQVLLRVQNIHLSFPRIAGLFLIGMFYNQFLPGGTGGDIIKSYLLLKETPDKKAGALLAVVFDRLIGLVALVAITVTLISLRFDILSKTP